jgi:peptidoglycan hydrolase-like protein with peptidoglycan-binding domain
VSRRAVIGAAAAALTLSVGVGVESLRPAAAGDAEPAGGAETAPETAAVARTTLSESETLGGTLAYADPQPLRSGASGMVTALPREGTVLRPGSVAARIDGRPVVVLPGRLPVYRSLRRGVEGADVLQLERALVRLGFDAARSITVDRTFSVATAAALKAFQRHYGLDRDGSLDAGDVVYLDGDRRVGALKAAVGADGAGELYETSRTRRVIEVAIDARRQRLLRRGRAVVVELPDGRRIDGRVTVVSPVARDGKDANDGSRRALIDVVVALPADAAVPDFERLPVDVHVVVAVATDVLAVPVHALLALAGGGYGVEKVDGAGTRRIVPVEIGASADGLVAISGDVAAGDAVVVAS